MDQHEILVLAVFCGVYLGMALGRWPALALDRTGIALCGAIVLLFFDETTGASAAGIDTGTLAVLFGSLANIIVAERARGEGVVLSFGDHLRSGVPMTLVTVALAYGWILLFLG